jgi:hypothetical protein
VKNGYIFTLIAIVGNGIFTILQVIKTVFNAFEGVGILVNQHLKKSITVCIVTNMVREPF